MRPNCALTLTEPQQRPKQSEELLMVSYGRRCIEESLIIFLRDRYVNHTCDTYLSLRGCRQFIQLSWENHCFRRKRHHRICSLGPTSKLEGDFYSFNYVRILIRALQPVSMNDELRSSLTLSSQHQRKEQAQDGPPQLTNDRNVMLLYGNHYRCLVFYRLCFPRSYVRANDLIATTWKAFCVIPLPRPPNFGVSVMV